MQSLVFSAWPYLVLGTVIVFAVSLSRLRRKGSAADLPLQVFGAVLFAAGFAAVWLFVENIVLGAFYIP